MGILKLMDFIKVKAPKALTPKTISSYQGKTLAIDASNWIYQFLIKTQTIQGGKIQMPTDWMGNQTGHLIGILSRIELCLTNKILPIWVFDGKPPEQKIQELRKRKLAKSKAEQQTQVVIEKIQQKRASQEPQSLKQSFDLLKLSKRSVKISNQEKNDAKKLIQLIGLPVIQSKSEAQPQCAAITKKGLAYGTISEDLDTLTFGSPRMIRSFNAKTQAIEIDLQTVLQQTGLSYEQFIDFSILCGCDYTSKIKGIGPVKANSMLQKYGNIDQILDFLINDENLSKKHPIPDDFNHIRARKLFMNPEIYDISVEDIAQKQFKRQDFIQFLNSKQFSSKRINNWIQRNQKTGMLK